MYILELNVQAAKVMFLLFTSKQIFNYLFYPPRCIKIRKIFIRCIPTLQNWHRKRSFQEEEEAGTVSKSHR